MKILLIAPGESPEAMEIDGSLETMQALVGGLTQAIYPFQAPVALVCNDDGKLLHLPPNRVLRDPATGQIYDIVVGTFFLCAAPPGSEQFESLSEEQLSRYEAHYHDPECFAEDFYDGMDI